MKQISLFLLIFSSFYRLPCAAQISISKDLWMNEKRVEENREPMHATFFAFENAKQAQIGDWSQSSNYTTLNGSWRFKWVENPSLAPKGWDSAEYVDNQWDMFKIPAVWEVNGYGYPIYINHGYEFMHLQKADPPRIPTDYNPVGMYRKEVEISRNFLDEKQIFVHIGAAKSNLAVWINGQYVGYGEDGKLPQEFNVTKYLKIGKNKIALQVMRWSDGTYLECQDMWRVSGITRDCYLVSRNKFGVRDIDIQADLDANYQNGSLGISLDFLGSEFSKNKKIKIELLDNQDIVFSKNIDIENFIKNKVMTFEVKTPKKWSAETPNLYQLLTTVLDENDKILEVIPQNIGFRKVEIKHGHFYVNGEKIYIKGVNRHEADPVTSQCISRELMETDVRLMKEYNINAVRTSHYPNDEYFYELCDRVGIYMIDEANIESHGMYYNLSRTLANKPSWKTAHLTRVQRAIERDKNHPSIITWSLGNEAGNGYNMYECYNWIKQRDPSRPVQYERTDVSEGGKIMFEWNTDVICPMYPHPDEMIAYAQNPDTTRPFIMCEYAHAMGNSVGNFKEYWDIIKGNETFQGGYIWDFVDQGFYKINENRDTVITYGGDYGPANAPTDQNFMCNGLFAPSRKPNPHVYEVKKVYQDISAKMIDEQTVEIFNEYFFKNLDNVRMEWQIIGDGKLLKKGVINDLSVAPRTRKTLIINTKVDKVCQEYFLNLSFKLKETESFLLKNHEIAAEQFALKGIWKNNLILKESDSLKTQESIDAYTISSSKMKAVFSRQTGLLTNFERNGKPFLAVGSTLKPNFWRAPTDNDLGSNLPVNSKVWKAASQNGYLLENMSLNSTNDKNIVLTANFSIPVVSSKLKIMYVINSEGEMTVEQILMTDSTKNISILPRFGMQLELAKGFENVDFYGRGPYENYVDRKTSAFVGLYSQSVKEQFFSYVRPQETGNKSDIRWSEISSTSLNQSLKVEGEKLLNVTVKHYFDEQLDEGFIKHNRHTGDLKPSETTQVNIDGFQTGLAGVDSWSTYPLKKYQLPYRNYSFKFKLNFN